MTKKEHFVLDLDQTLISAEATEEYDFKENGKKAKKFTYHNMDGYYIVFERPNLQNFLDYLFKTFNVSIWTAASKDYAMFVIENAILKGHPERKIDYVFFSYHCNISKKIKKGSKDLSMLWDVYGIDGFKKNNTMILDDYDEVHDTQPENCIIAIPFKFTENGSENDNFLMDLLEKIKNKGKIHKMVKDINSKN
jgi:hypothetical protein